LEFRQIGGSLESNPQEARVRNAPASSFFAFLKLHEAAIVVEFLKVQKAPIYKPYLQK
jgi:hypothetical protein